MQVTSWPAKKVKKANVAKASAVQTKVRKVLAVRRVLKDLVVKKVKKVLAVKKVKKVLVVKKVKRVLVAVMPEI